MTKARLLLAAMLLSLFSISASSQCDFTEVIATSTTGGWGYEMNWTLVDENDEEVGGFVGVNDDETTEQTLCLEDGCYTLFANDTYGDGWNGGSVEFDIDAEIVFFEMTSGSDEAIAFGVNMEGCIVVIWGCTDPEAINYNPLATDDDGSCSSIEDILAEQSITFMLESGPKDNRINWALQNRGMPNANDEFDSEEEFIQMYQEGLLEAFTPGSPIAKVPFAQYHEFFNLQTWWWPDAPSTETGWNWTLLKGMRDEYFLPWADDEHGWATLFSTSKWGGGGGAGVQPETRTGDGLMYGMEWETLLHEFCHTMPQIPDEYSASGTWSGGQCWEGPNTSPDMVRDSIPWRLWIDEETPLPTPYIDEHLNTIGAFEGALTNYFGCHRPTARGCYMGAGGFGDGYGQDLCTPCVQRTICLLYRYVNVIENPLPDTEFFTVTGNETITFSADIVKPEPNTQHYRWLLNGQVIAEDVEEVEVSFGNCESYTLILEVEDLTDLVRWDPLYDHIYPKPFQSHTWTIEQTDIDDYSLYAEATVTSADCTGDNNGEVGFEIGGGVPGYMIFLDGEEVSNPHTGLASGDAAYWVVDDNGCGVQVLETVGQDELLWASVCTVHDGQNWTAFADFQGYDEVEFLWSDGTDEQTTDGLSNGDHWLQVTTADGCMIQEDFSLSTPGAPLEVTAFVLPSSTEENNGRIDLTVAGGIPPYTVEWIDRPVVDLTYPDENQIQVSGYNWDHLPEMAFDDDLDTKWLHWVEQDAWISFEFEGYQIVTMYSMTSGDDVEERDPKDWVFEGSNDGANWTVIDERFDEDFPERRQRKLYLTDNNTPFLFYRFWVNENSGDDTIQLQELEFMGASIDGELEYNPAAEGLFNRLDLPPGTFTYVVRDANDNCVIESVNIEAYQSYVADGLVVVQDGPCSVKIEEPIDGFDYFWLSDEAGTEILGMGDSFSPPAYGNYWVAALDESNDGLSSNRPGFAVTMPDSPDIVEVSEGVLGVDNPDSDLIYRWYTEDCGGDYVHEGETYEPGTTPEQYYVASWWAEPFPDPIDPTDVDGLMVRMDAADLDGDGEIDEPRPETSSLYGWDFSEGGGSWNEGSWFALRGNHQNGLGVADFATMWLQCFQPAFEDYSTIVLAYHENELSWEGSAPFYGLSDRFPFSASENQLYSDDVDITTLNGITMLNGELVDPMETANPFEFCIHAQTFTESAGWTDCTHTHWEGMLGEALFYEDELSEEDLVGISEFLRKKWISTADLESVRTCVNWNGTDIGIATVKTGQSGLVIYPNPYNSSSVAMVSLPNAQDFSLTLVSTNGQVIEQAQFNGEKTFVSLSPWMEGLAQGVYMIVVKTESGIHWAERVVVR